ncbi:Uncharacterised protein [BD1-7 clade bacterium]|uniref:Uncharacterized protein n=1 Tax=BD1-7 clade bacterium TaxID=2029982 RepID=A0A5S9PJ74_9GAMM|nr:Uncharacterised protein [BD1-7 clade bacterium]
MQPNLHVIDIQPRTVEQLIPVRWNGEFVFTNSSFVENQI